MNTAVFRLENDADDPRFYGFVFRDDRSILGRQNIYRDFFGLEPEGRVARLAPVWTPREVVGNVLPLNDFPTVGNIPAFSQRGTDTLRDFLEPNGELLPLVTPSGCGEYYVYNITTMAGALDASKSDIGITGTGRHEFVPDRLAGLTIFRVAQHPRFAYVTEGFVERIRQHGLGGFLLMKVWPMPQDMNWYQQAQLEKKTRAGEIEGSGSVGSRPVAPKRGSDVTSRNPMPGKEKDSLDRAIANFGDKLGISAMEMEPGRLQAWISGRLEHGRASGWAPDDGADYAFWLAIAWGQSLVRSIGWEWVMLEDGKGAKTLAVASRNRSHAVPVIQYLERLVSGPVVDPNSELLYNMIVANDIPPARPGQLRLLG